MQPISYLVSRGGKCTTVRTCRGAVGAAIGLFNLTGKISWVIVEHELGTDTLVNGEITVTQWKL